jgi:L-amino acid N-acyltransferase YncA
VTSERATRTRAPASYPTAIELAGTEIALRLMTADDQARMLAFARSLPPHDLLFLRRDITKPEQVQRWAADIEAGSMVTVLAIVDDAIVGYASVDRTPWDWMQHVGELRVLVGPAYRRHGLGRVLTNDAFSLAVKMGSEKLVAQMTQDQEAALAVFARLGFTFEARMREHVKDRDGRKYDLIVMSRDLSPFQGALEAMGAISE